MYIGIFLDKKSRVISLGFSDKPEKTWYPLYIFLPMENGAELLKEKLSEGFRLSHISLGDEYEAELRRVLSLILNILGFREVGNALL